MHKNDLDFLKRLGIYLIVGIPAVGAVVIMRKVFGMAPDEVAVLISIASLAISVHALEKSAWH